MPVGGPQAEPYLSRRVRTVSADVLWDPHKTMLLWVVKGFGFGEEFGYLPGEVLGAGAG